jgi:hypothetical protein
MTQSDLSEHLFDVFLTLKDKSLEGEKLTEEIARSKALTEVASQMIANGALVLSACKMSENVARNIKLPPLLVTD